MCVGGGGGWMFIFFYFCVQIYSHISVECESLSRIMIRLLAWCFVFFFVKGMEQIHIQIIFGAMHFVFLSLCLFVFCLLLSCLTVIYDFKCY